MSTSHAASSTRTVAIIAGCLVISLLIPGLCLADQVADLRAAGDPTLLSDSIPEPQQPAVEPEDEPAACPIREEDQGQPVSRVDTRYLPQPTIFAAEQINRWGGGGGQCENISLCCHDWMCEEPMVAPECVGMCDLNTYLCVPN